MKALHFGAGNIGRFHWKITGRIRRRADFADANTQLVDQLNHSQEYQVRGGGDTQHRRYPSYCRSTGWQ